MFSFVKKKTKFHEFAQIFSKLFELKMVLDYLPNLFPLRQEMLFMLHPKKYNNPSPYFKNSSTSKRHATMYLIKP